VYSVVEFKTI